MAPLNIILTFHGIYQQPVCWTAYLAVNWCQPNKLGDRYHKSLENFTDVAFDIPGLIAK